MNNEEIKQTTEGFLNPIEIPETEEFKPLETVNLWKLTGEEEYDTQITAYNIEATKYNEDVNAFNTELEGYKSDVDVYNKAAKQFNTQLTDYKKYMSLLRKEAQQLEVRDCPKSNSFRNRRRQKWIVADMH